MKPSNHILSFADRFLLLIPLSGFVIAYIPVIKDLVHTWYNSEDYSHGFFVIPLCLYFIWLKKETIQRQKISVSFAAIPVLIASLTVYLFATYAGIKTIASLSFISTIACSTWALFGFATLRSLLFPIGFLLFMIPIPEQIYSSLTIPLQLFVSQISVALTKFLNIPVFREGNVIHLPNKTFEVINACSGIRSLITLLCLGSVFSFLFLKRSSLQAILILTCVPISIFVNVFRVFFMIILFHYFGIDMSEEHIHSIFGIIIFIISLFIINFFKGVLVLWDEKKLL